jgi:hypothetical protein
MAEKEKREMEEIYEKAEGTKTSKIFLVIGGLILILIGIFGSQFLIKKKQENIKPIVKNNIETFISYDLKSEIDVTNIFTKSDLIKIINEESKLNLESIKAIFFTKKIKEENEKLISRDFLSLIGVTAPGALVRSLTDEYLLGKYLDKKNQQATFLILETTDYNQAYASMLNWEETMPVNLLELFNLSYSEARWRDAIINNKDARVLYNESGNELLYYVFFNKNILIITNNTEALKEVINRLIIKNSQR